MTIYKRYCNTCGKYYEGGEKYCSPKCYYISKKKLNLTKEELERLYWEKELSLNEIAKKYKVDGVTVLYWMKKYNILRRSKAKIKFNGINSIKREELEDLYNTKRLSSSQIAEKFGVSSTTIRQLMKEYNIIRRNNSEAHLSKNARLPTKENLIRLYCKDKLSVKEISSTFSVSTTTIYNLMRRYNIQRKPQRKFYLSKEELENLYWKEKKDTFEIAEIYGVEFNTVRRWMKKYEIPTRSYSEIQTNCLEKDPTLKDRVSNGVKQYFKEHPKERERISKFWEEYYSDPLVKLQHKEDVIKRLKDHPELHPNVLVARRGDKSKPEKKVYTRLLSMGFIEDIDFSFNKPIQTETTIRYPDFRFPKLMTIIEVDGTYWHKNKLKEAIRDTELKDLGYDVYHLTDKEINNNFRYVQNQLENILK